MPANFGNLSKLDVDPMKQVEYTFFHITWQPTLLVVYAGESNKPLLNEQIKAGAGPRARATQQMVRAGNVDARMLLDVRDESKKLYARHVVRGWKNVVDAAGKPVEFSVEECEAFFGALPDWLYVDFVEFVTNAANFVNIPVHAEGAATF